jgi:hypothetical protein
MYCNISLFGNKFGYIQQVSISNYMFIIHIITTSYNFILWNMFH